MKGKLQRKFDEVRRNVGPGLEFMGIRLVENNGAYVTWIDTVSEAERIINNRECHIRRSTSKVCGTVHVNVRIK